MPFVGGRTFIVYQDNKRLIVNSLILALNKNLGQFWIVATNVNVLEK